MINIVKQELIKWIEKIKYLCIFTLLVFLPINDTIVSIFTTYLKLPQLITLWKEALIIILILCFSTTFNFKKHWYFIFLFFCLCTLAFFSSYTNYGEVSGSLIRPLSRQMLGFRFELLWVGVLALVIGQNQFDSTLKTEKKVFDYGLYLGFALVIAVSMFTLIAGNEFALSSLGFNKGWGIGESGAFNTPYCQNSNGGLISCRLTAGMSSPNNLAGYLIFILLYSIYLICKKYSKIQLIVGYCATFVSIILMYLTFSRFLFVVLIVIILLFFCWYIFAKSKSRLVLRKILIVTTLLLPVLSIAFFQSVFQNEKIFAKLPTAISKVGSSKDHLALTNIAIESIVRDGTSLLMRGYGITTSGPVGKPEYDTPQYSFINSNFVIKNQDIANKYEIKPFNMSVPENWFLQVIINGGWVYFLIYLYILIFSIKDIFCKKTFTKELLLARL